MEQMLSELTEITPNLYISSATAITEQKLANRGITLIVNATKELPHFPCDEDVVKRVRVPVYDNAEANIFPYFKVSFNFFFNLKKLILFLTAHFRITLRKRDVGGQDVSSLFGR